MDKPGKDEAILVFCKELEKQKNGDVKNWGIRHFETVPKDETYRTNFRRHRDKILYTGGFRRLQDKTQVISSTKNGDHRTRLTHTMEVEQIATSLADALGLNTDLVSAIALGHDVGHTPFGHAVEQVLDEKLAAKGGFSHAVQSVRYLSEKMREKEENGKDIKLDEAEMLKNSEKIQDLIFEGILKHDADIYSGDYNREQFDCDKYKPYEAGMLEMQVVYWSDKIAYLTHDLEDFYHSEIYTNTKKHNIELEEELKIVLSELIVDKKEDILLDIVNYKSRDLIRSVINELLNKSIENIIDIFANNSENKEINSEYFRDKSTMRIKKAERKLVEEKRIKVEDIKIEKVREMKDSLRSKAQEEELSKIKEKLRLVKRIRKDAYNAGLIINFDDEYRKNYNKLRDILDEHYIGSPEIARSDAKAKNIACSLFEMFVGNEKLLPINIKRLVGKDQPKERVIADYIASMTDRYAEAVYNDLNAISGHYAY